MYICADYLFFFFFFYGYGDHRVLRVLTHSFPTRRSSDLSAEVFAFAEDDFAAVEFGEGADDREAEAGAGFRGVEPGAAAEQLAPAFFGNAGAVVLDQDLDELAGLGHGDEYPAVAVFGGVFDEVAEQFLQILAFACKGGVLVAGDIDRRMGV